MATKSPTDEIREIRHKLAARFDNDVDRIFEDLIRQQRESGLKYVSLPRRVPEAYAVPIASFDSGQQPLDQSLPSAPPAR